MSFLINKNTRVIFGVKKYLPTVATVLVGFTGLAAHGQDVEHSLSGSLSDQFLNLCVFGQGVAQQLPGTDVAIADAPFQLKYYAEPAIASRVVKIGGIFAMRALNPSRADPSHAIIIRCAVTGSGSFGEEVNHLSEKLAVAPQSFKTLAGFDAALFQSDQKSFQVFAEADGSVSIFRIEIMMHNIDRKYLKKGAKPVPLPSVR